MCPMESNWGPSSGAIANENLAASKLKAFSNTEANRSAIVMNASHYKHEQRTFKLAILLPVCAAVKFQDAPSKQSFVLENECCGLPSSPDRRIAIVERRIPNVGIGEIRGDGLHRAVPKGPGCHRAAMGRHRLQRPPLESVEAHDFQHVAPFCRAKAAAAASSACKGSRLGRAPANRRLVVCTKPTPALPPA